MEFEFIHWLRRRVPPHPRLAVGIGDDAAVIANPEGPDSVLTVDLLTDRVDFVLGEVEPRRVGHKALGANLSDIAAMAARPVAAVVSVVFPVDGATELAHAIYEGMIPLAERYDVALAGGDTNSWEGPLAISVTVQGEVTERGPLRRDGARPGDHIVVTGGFGGSILGRHLDVEPRIEEALTLHERYELHAGIDCSDGLAIDLSRVAEASGCGAMIRPEAVPIHADAHRLSAGRRDGVRPLDHALGDGEDFELILAVPAAEAARLVDEQPLGVPLTEIGVFVKEPGLWQLAADGTRHLLPATGFEHRLD